jgi:AcrB/AcrD/AcrF family
MTSMAFVMGVVPLVFSSGAGFEMRNAIGVTVFSGMIGVTLLGIFITPMFYVLLRTLSGAKLTSHHEGDVCHIRMSDGRVEEVEVLKSAPKQDKKPAKGKGHGDA